MVCSDGTLIPAGATPTASGVTAIAVLGLAEHQQNNTGAIPNVIGPFIGGATAVKCEKGAWALPFDTAPSWASVGAPVYAVDDQTVSLTQTPSGGSARLQVGTLAGLDLNGVPFVEIG